MTGSLVAEVPLDQLLIIIVQVVHVALFATSLVGNIILWVFFQEFSQSIMAINPTLLPNPRANFVLSATCSIALQLAEVTENVVLYLSTECAAVGVFNSGLWRPEGMCIGTSKMSRSKVRGSIFMLNFCILLSSFSKMTSDIYSQWINSGGKGNLRRPWTGMKYKSRVKLPGHEGGQKCISLLWSSKAGCLCSSNVFWFCCCGS